MTEFDNTEAVLRKLDINNLDDLQDFYVVKVKWFTDCMKAGHVIDVTDDHKVKAPENADVMFSFLYGTLHPSQQFFSHHKPCQDNFLSSWVEPVLLKQRIKCPSQGHNTLTLLAVSFELAAYFMIPSLTLYLTTALHYLW